MKKKAYKMMNNLKRTLVFKGAAGLGVLCLALTGCMGNKLVNETSGTANLAPMAVPQPEINQRVYLMNNITGDEEYYDIKEIREDGSFTAVNNLGCSWESASDLLSPTESWSDCSDDPKWHSGENRNIEITGKLWPLSVGNEASYAFQQYNALGESNGKRTRKCVVKDIVNIEAGGSSMDTYKVVCTERDGSWSSTRTIYFSPSVGWNVRFLRSTSSGGVKSNTETLRVESS